ncbi:MAG TPA: hypothetical protein VEI57_07600, partial [Nitrospirota bacterium]|nr:hypothetical protein [Nitrospirota bacterium]
PQETVFFTPSKSSSSEVLMFLLESIFYVLMLDYRCVQGKCAFSYKAMMSGLQLPMTNNLLQN